MNARLPIGSYFVLTLPFNGATVIENGGYTKDPLFLLSKEYVHDFEWETHTFTHPELDGLTYAQVQYRNVLSPLIHFTIGYE